MQVRQLIGRYAGQVIEMPYDRAVANRALGHVQFLEDAEPSTPAPVAQAAPRPTVSLPARKLPGARPGQR